MIPKLNIFFLISNYPQNSFCSEPDKSCSQPHTPLAQNLKFLSILSTNIYLRFGSSINPLCSGFLVKILEPYFLPYRASYVSTPKLCPVLISIIICGGDLDIINTKFLIGLPFLCHFPSLTPKQSPQHFV